MCWIPFLLMQDFYFYYYVIENNHTRTEELDDNAVLKMQEIIVPLSANKSSARLLVQILSEFVKM